MAPAVATAVVQLLGSRVAVLASGADLPHPAFFLPVLLAGPAALLLRRRFPYVTQGIAAVAMIVWLAVTQVSGPVWLSLAVAAVSAAAGSASGRQGARRRATAYCILGATWAVAWLGLPLAGRLFVPWAAVAGSLAWVLVVVAVSEGLRARRAAAADRRRHAEQEALTREQERRRRASDERLAVARELHDVIGHSLSMITVQSGVALELMDARPEVAREALTAIRAASRDALVEVHGVLASLRGEDDDAAQRPPRTPAPSIADLDALLARPRAAGLQVEARTEGDLAGLPVAVDLAAARIVQEALTNVARHAGGAAAARVLLRRTDAALVVVVDDDGPATSHPMPTGGNGVPGMRERAAALGGRLAAGPREGPRDQGGWRVEAELPLTHPTTDVASGEQP
ncbi:Signal transduction histidine kinase [Quadrisphaera granulorum]|uniref:histidine kinase n=2 Tax=Quadrisphaera granulorum TaxID=317664 RepID=A0A315ZP81_9ACTN|nr:signal transduction histidine kinase [Quadrisphaera granulorum]SZE99042.1 Signal transduction histidine kinase [Quadrisphaera granulorum]